MNITNRILVLGGTGLVGSALVRELLFQGFTDVIYPSRLELDLSRQADTLDYFEQNRPDVVFLAAARVGGIRANDTYRADFIFENLRIETNVFEACFKSKVRSLLFLGSSCVYPKLTPQPMREDSLLTASLEQTNEPYAIAKIAGLKLAENFRRQYGCRYFSAMPTNLYGPGDNFHKDDAHVIPGLISRLTEAMATGATTFKVWGSGLQIREFLYVDDLARACLHLLKAAETQELPYWVNVGSGRKVTIREVAQLIAELMGFRGRLEFDVTKLEGTPEKFLDSSFMTSLGWSPQVSLEDGLRATLDFHRSLAGS